MTKVEVVGERTAWNMEGLSGQVRVPLTSTLSLFLSLAACLRDPGKGQAGKGWARELLWGTEALCCSLATRSRGPWVVERMPAGGDGGDGGPQPSPDSAGAA